MSRNKHKSNNKQISKSLDKEFEEKGEAVPEDVAEIINKLPKEDRKVITRVLSVKQTYSGPLPDGENIRIYNEVIPNGGDRLMSTVEKQLDHRIDMENKGLSRSFNQSSTGQWMGFAIAIVFGIIAWDLAKSGFTVAASILGTVDLVALVAVFITGRSSK
ncbi:MAG: DUF2335 domain-containing protein [Zunongwangia sp.]|uniref:DUF2335 domain-containing protein n=1 Tax=Zunongwangia sp. TaxID=1965325 RepID=UPI003242A984